MPRLVPALIIAAIAVAAKAAGSEPGFAAVDCEGTYPHHLQGVATDEQGAIFWCFTTRLVKTDRTGRVLAQVDAANHHGDLCYRDGKVYVAVNLGKFNRPEGSADCWVYVYRADDLSLLSRHPAAEVVHGAGGIAWQDGRFMVVGGLPPGVDENYVYEYDEQLKFVKRHVLKSGYTLMGIQTAAFGEGHWWFGCYGLPKILLKADASLERVERYEFDCSLGIVAAGRGRFLVARGSCSGREGCSGRLVEAEHDAAQGLVLRDKP